MRTQVREILRKMEDHCAPLVSTVRTTHGVLDDKDTFSNSDLSLMDVLNLKRVLTKLDERVRSEHYNAAYAARNTYTDRGQLITEEEFKVLYTELDKPRTFPEPELPDRELTLKEKGRVLNLVENALREFGLVDNPCSVSVPVQHLKGNGMETEYLQMADSAIGRRLVALHKELVSLRNAVTPMIAKDKTPFAGRSYWNTGNQWNKEHIRTCHSCGSVCDVYTHNWETVKEKPQ